MAERTCRYAHLLEALARQNAEDRERDLRIVRRAGVLLLREAARCEERAGRCPDWSLEGARLMEEARAARATERDLRRLVERWEAEEC